MKNYLLAIIGEIRPKALYYSTANLKIHKKSNFDRNQLKISTHHKYMYMYQKKL